jgi:hypothetical protein
MESEGPILTYQPERPDTCLQVENQSFRSKLG